MKSRLCFPLLATVALGALAFSAQPASAQCDYYDSGFGFSFEIRRGYNYHVPDRFYYEEDCDYNYNRGRGRYVDDYEYERYDRRPAQQTRRVIRVYPDGRAVPNGMANSSPVVTTRRQSPEPRTAVTPKQPVQSFEDSRSGPVSPYLNDPLENTGPAKREIPNKPAATFDLELPDPAPRQNRNAERLPAPEIPAPPSTPKSVNVGNKSAVVDGEFPLDLVIANSDDEFVTVREMIGDNQAILIDFWASWCGPCIQSMPELKRRAEGLRDIKVAVAGMNVESDVAIAKQIRKKHGMERVIWLVEPKSQPFSDKFKIDSIPQVILVDRNGSVLFKGFPNDRKLEAALDKLAGD